MGERSLARAFDRHANGLNLLRLCLAAGVIVWHSFPLTGHNIAWKPLHQLMADIWVDGFFAISGFLIAGSWLGRPKLGPFFRARALRILPGFYLCLLFTALVLAPVMVVLSGGGQLGLSSELAYVKANALMWVTRYDIAGTPVGVPYPHVWNGSTWTLAWESMCYIGVAVLGVVGLLRRRWAPLVAFALVWIVAAGVAIGAPHTQNYFVTTGSRFGVMFLAGILVQLWMERIPIRPWLIVGSIAALLGASVLPDYRLLAALPLAYLLIVAGSAMRSPRLWFRNDISYGVYVYAFPVQQSLAMLGAWKLGVPFFALLAMLCTIPFAAASWFWVERPALKMKTRKPVTSPEAAPTTSK